MASIVEPRAAMPQEELSAAGIGFDCEDGGSSGQQARSQRKKAVYVSMAIALGALLGASLFLVMGSNGLSPSSHKFATAHVPRAAHLPRAALPSPRFAGISMADVKTTKDSRIFGAGFPAVGKRQQVKRWFLNLRSPKKRKQDFLELSPYFARKGIPMNTYKPKVPFTAKIQSVERMVGPKAMGETCNIIIDHGGNVPYIEGQSYGVVPPGVNPKNGRPNAPRLYSIASSRYGDDMTGNTATLCVKRATYWDPVKKAEDPAKQGICSNYMCDLKAGDEIKLTGPTGAAMLLPEDQPEADIIMFATGTGIAPFRAFLRRMFVENTPYGNDFKGLAWLFLGVYNKDSLLYDEEWKDIKSVFPENFRYDVALSNEQKNKDGGSMYVQDRASDYAEELFDRMDKGAHVYICGLKGMLPGIQEMLEKVAKDKGVEYDDFMKKIKGNKQWHVEVY